MSAVLHHGPAADMLREHIAPASVQMVYADPPFGNDQEWRGTAGAFSDRWRPSTASESGWSSLRRASPAGAVLLEASVRGYGPTAAPYLGVMAGILIECRRALDLRGSLWLHHDDTMGAQLRVLGDIIFGPQNLLGSVVWKRSSNKNSKRNFARAHDTISAWGRSRASRMKLWRLGSEFALGDPVGGGSFKIDGFADDALNARSSERVGYPTQKPLSLLKRLVLAATDPGDTVLDPTCGSGSTLVAARTLGRCCIGVDISANAIAAARRRLGGDYRLMEPAAVARPDLFARAA